MKSLKSLAKQKKYIGSVSNKTKNKNTVDKKNNESQKNKYQKTLRTSGLSLSQLLSRLRQKRLQKVVTKKRGSIKSDIIPIIPPKYFFVILQEKPEKISYNYRIIDYKHCGLLQTYIGLGGKILPRKQTRLAAKQQRYVAKTIKSSRVVGLLPFVSKERGFFK